MRVLALLIFGAASLGAHAITSASPSQRTAGTGTFDISLTGTFFTHDEPRFDGVLVQRVSVTSTTMVIRVPGSLLVNNTSQPRVVLISSVADATPEVVTFPFTINPPLRLIPETNPAPLQVNVSAAPIQHTTAGGTAPFSFNCTALPRSLPPGMTLVSNTSGCVLSGTPTAAGNYSYTIAVSDSGGVSQLSRTYQVQVQAPLTITSTTLPAGTAGTPYSATLAASGGVPPYTWSLNAGSLPPGLNLASNGQISGTPTTAGTFTFNVRVTDSAVQVFAPVPGPRSATTTGNVSITIQPATPPLAITTDSVPAATAGVSYNFALAATGGTPPYTWALAAGPLPAGITLSPAGLLSGTPTQVGSFPFTARVSDSANRNATRSFTLVVNSNLSIVSTAAPNASQGVPYSFSFTASGGIQPYVWSLAAGNLPGGLSLSPAGLLSGTPTQTGSFNFTVRVTDAANGSATRAFTVNVAAGLTITTSSLPQGTRGVVYNFVFSAAGGQPPYAWAITSGVTPAGLNLNASTGEFSGVPTATGTFAFVIRVTDAAGSSASASITVAVVATALVIDTTSLPGGTVGAFYSQSISASGGVPPYAFNITGGSLPAGLSLNVNTGLLSGTPSAAGAFTFLVIARDAVQQTATRSYTIVVTAQSAALPTGVVGTPYRHRVETSGLTPPVQCALIGGRLPGGLSLGGDCELSGTPTEATTASLTVQFRDGQNRLQSVVFELTILPALTLRPDTLPPASVRQPYAAALAASGGAPPYSYTATGLPGGLTLNAQSGVISGTPAAAGTFSVAVTVTDSANNRLTRQYSLVVAAGLTLSDAELPQGEIGTAYGFTLTASGGATPYSFALRSGFLPPGLTLASSGRITGTPTASGGTTFIVEVTDAARNTATGVFSLLVPVPRATAEADFNWRFLPPAPSLGSRCVLAAGSLPPGISLNENECTAGPRPTQPGVYDFHLRFGSGGQTADVRQVITVLPAVRILPGALPAGLLGAEYRVTLRAEGGTPPYRFQFPSGLPSGFSFNSDTSVLSGVPAAAGVHRIAVQVTDANPRFPGVAAATYELEVTAPAAPALRAPGAPASANPQDQVRISLESSAAYPAAILGRLRLTFTPDAEQPADDPAVRFSNNSRELAFTLAAGQTNAAFPGVPVPAIQVGTTAGLIAVTATLEAGGVNLTPTPIPVMSIRIARSAPVITGVEVTRSGTAVTVLVSGYATARALTGARFRFTAAAGATLQTGELTPAVTELFTGWFRDSRSGAFGSQFLYTQPFTVQGDATQLRSVEVVLTNAQGSSAAVSRQF